jgi:hypothetical protein
MNRLFLFLFFTLPSLVYAQSDMRVYTVAGAYTHVSIPLGDGGPATAATLWNTEGIWMDGSCNLYISDNYNRVRKVNTSTGIITTLAGNGIRGYSGDGGPATNAQICLYGLWSDPVGNVYFADPNYHRIRRVDALSGIITTIAGNGTQGYSGDAIPATDAELNQPAYVYGDNSGNIYIGEMGHPYTLGSRLRKVNATGIISTMAGTGFNGYSGDGGSATNAQVAAPAGMLVDGAGNFYFADRGNSVVRKIDSKGIITTYAGSTDGYSGNGGPATNAQLSGPIGIVMDYLGNMVIGDNQNDCIRKVDAKTGIITSIAGKDTAYYSGSTAEGVPATDAAMHPEFMYLDRSGNIYYSCYCNQVHKVTHYNAALPESTNECGETSTPIITRASNDIFDLYPNPVTDGLHIGSINKITSVSITNLIGLIVSSNFYHSEQVQVDVAALPAGMYLLRINGTEIRKFIKQ